MFHFLGTLCWTDARAAYLLKLAEMLGSLHGWAVNSESLRAEVADDELNLRSADKKL